MITSPEWLKPKEKALLPLNLTGLHSAIGGHHTYVKLLIDKEVIEGKIYLLQR